MPRPFLYRVKSLKRHVPPEKLAGAIIVMHFQNTGERLVAVRPNAPSLRQRATGWMARAYTLVPSLIAVPHQGPQGIV